MRDITSSTRDYIRHHERYQENLCENKTFLMKEKARKLPFLVTKRSLEECEAPFVGLIATQDDESVLFLISCVWRFPSSPKCNYLSNVFASVNSSYHIKNLAKEKAFYVKSLSDCETQHNDTIRKVPRNTVSRQIVCSDLKRRATENESKDVLSVFDRSQFYRKKKCLRSFELTPCSRYFYCSTVIKCKRKLTPV